MSVKITTPGTYLSPAQRAAIRHAELDGGRLIRHPGGYWITPATGFHQEAGYTAPDWHTTIHTVRALERMGKLVRTHELPEEWRDPRVLVP